MEYEYVEHVLHSSCKPIIAIDTHGINYVDIRSLPDVDTEALIADVRLQYFEHESHLFVMITPVLVELFLRDGHRHYASFIAFLRVESFWIIILLNELATLIYISGMIYGISWESLWYQVTNESPYSSSSPARSSSSSSTASLECIFTALLKILGDPDDPLQLPICCVVALCGRFYTRIPTMIPMYLQTLTQSLVGLPYNVFAN